MTADEDRVIYPVTVLVEILLQIVSMMEQIGQGCN